MPADRTRKSRRIVRHLRVRQRVRGLSQRPRLAVFRSLNHIYAQIIDDTQGVTLASASSLEGQIRQLNNGKSKSEISKVIGTLIAQRAEERGITTVVFDRGGYKFHGRIKALAESARDGGLVF